MDNKCTVLVSSCDNYEDTWYPFFKLLKENWSNIPYEIVLNTESKSFCFNGLDIKTFNLYSKNKNVAWGKRLIENLKLIDSEYVIFLLDDFFLMDKVDHKRIEECIKWLDDDKDISVFYFRRGVDNNIKDNLYPGFERIPQNGEYKLECQAAIWRREKLISYIRPHETPWEWEVFGSERSHRYSDKFYSSIIGEPYVFEYNFKKYGITKGKWIEGTDELFKKYNINIDLEKRGIIERKNIYVPIDLSFLKRVKRKFKFLYSKYLSLKKY